MLSEKAQDLADSPAYPRADGRPWSATAPHGMTVRQRMVMQNVAAFIVQCGHDAISQAMDKMAITLNATPRAVIVRLAGDYADTTLEDLVREPENPHG